MGWIRDNKDGRERVGKGKAEGGQERSKEGGQ